MHWTNIDLIKLNNNNTTEASHVTSLTISSQRLYNFNFDIHKLCNLSHLILDVHDIKFKENLIWPQHIKNISITSLKLTTLPDIIFKLNIECLILYCPNIKYISPEILNLQSLYILNIKAHKSFSFNNLISYSNNNNETLHNEILHHDIQFLLHALPLLRYFTVNNIKMKTININDINYIDYKNNDICTIEPILFKIENLIYLDLSNNNISIIPNTIHNLVNLNYLNLNNNNIKLIPPDLNKLTKLQELHIRSNSINVINIASDKLFKLDVSHNNIISYDLVTPLLSTLHLNHNKITNTSKLNTLCNLRQLYLQHNNIKFLSNIDKLTKLEELYINDNCISVLSNSFYKLSNLYELDVSHNKLTTIPYSFKKLNKLISCNLSFNKITILPNIFKQLSSLQSLDIRHNNIKFLPSSLNKLNETVRERVMYDSGINIKCSYNLLYKITYTFQNITNLNISNNKLIIFPASILELNNLRILEINNNLLTELPVNINKLTNITDLYLFDNEISALPLSFYELTTLNYLDISNNNITEIDNNINKLQSLYELDISYNFITSLPVTFSQLHLSDLTLSNNMITTISDEICLMTSLINIDLCNNFINYISPNINNLIYLETLYLSHNKIQRLPQITLNTLEEITLDDNPLINIPVSIGNLNNIGNNQYVEHEQPYTTNTKLTLEEFNKIIFKYINSNTTNNIINTDDNNVIDNNNIDNNNIDNKCIICMDNLKNMIELECKHIFHIDCIKKWLIEYSNSCPTCRKIIS